MTSCHRLESAKKRLRGLGRTRPTLNAQPGHSPYVPAGAGHSGSRARCTGWPRASRNVDLPRTAAADARVPLAAAEPPSPPPCTPYGSLARCKVAVGPCRPLSGIATCISAAIGTTLPRTPYGSRALGAVAVGHCLLPGCRVALRRHQPRSVLPRTPYGSRAHGAVAVGHCPPHGAFAESLVVAAGSPRSTQPRTPYGSHTRCVVAVGPCLPPVRATGPPSSVARYLPTPSRTPYGFHALGVVAVGPCLPPSVPAWSFRTRPCRLPAVRSSLSAPAGAPTRPLSSAQRIQESPPDF